MNMDQYIKDFDLYQLLNLKEKIEIKIAYLSQLPEVELYVVSDSWMNYGYYAMSDYKNAVNHVIKLYNENSHDDESGFIIKKLKFNSDEAAKILKEYK